IVASSEKFMTDDCLTKASSIAYTTIVSLIPTLAVALTFFSFGGQNRKDQLFLEVQKFLETYNLNRLNIDPFIDAISTLIDNAASIGGIGAVVLVFSATAVLRTMEHSLNTIWNVKRQRSWVLKMIYYWTALTLGPLMLIAGTTAAAQISTIFSAPNYRAITQTRDGTIWLGGNKGTLRHTGNISLPFEKVTSEQIDFDNQFVYRYDSGSEEFYKDDSSLDELELAKAEFRDIQFRGENGWAVGKDGIILRTSDSGEKWRIEKWGSFNFKNILMRDDKNGFITSEGGYFLRTTDGGLNWRVQTWPEVTGDINQISFYGKTGIAVCNRGYILRSDNDGADWTPVLIEKSQTKKQRYANLNSVSFFTENQAWIGCSDGLILSTADGFKTFNAKHFKRYNYSSVLMTGPNEGYAAGEGGILIHTSDGGNTWVKRSIHTGNIFRLVKYSGAIWAIGSAGLVLHGKSMDSSWEGEKGTGFIIYLLNFFLPFIFIWVFFLLTYLLLPNTRVPFRPAAIGASISGATWVGFILGFIVYVKAFANGTFAVYGALAAFPIFLLLVYASAVILLYGGEVSYMIVYLDSFLKQKKLKKAGHELSVYAAVRILHAVYKKFETGHGSSELTELVKLTEKSHEANYFVNLFKKENILLEQEGGGIIPGSSSENVKLTTIIDLVHDANLTIPDNAPHDMV
ncbi:MAG TPA: YhjD/YihY/BrkB family envelope integrity protein, partial [Spirochaetota bacterium]